MKTTVKVLGLGIAMIGFIACTQISSPNRAEYSYVEVVGTAEKEIEPDIFYLSFSLESKDDINALEQRLLAALQSLDIDTKNDLSVTNMSGDRYWWRKNNTRYQYKRYLLKAHKLDLVNKTCDKLDNLKVNYYLSKVDYSQIDELKEEVQREAVKQARQKAENLLSGENKQIGGLIYLQEQETAINRPFDRNYMSNADSPPPMLREYESPAFTKIKISYSIIARFSIQ